MKFENHTALGAVFQFGGLAPGVHGGWVVARTTWRIERSGALAPEPTTPCPLLDEPLETEFGLFPPDRYAVHFGCELVIAGIARPRRRARRQRVEARVGSYRDAIDVFGDRVWRRARGELVPSDPLPFEAMPLTWARAFGGATVRHGVTEEHPLNPVGRGYYATEEAALDRPLANLEDPRTPVVAWDARPSPVAWAPTARAQRWQLWDWLHADNRGADAPSMAELEAFLARAVPCAAPPRRVMAKLEDGAPIRIDGLGLPIEFRAPHTPAVLRVEVGGDTKELRLAHSGLWIFAEAGLVVLTHRARFRYPVRAHERRTARLVEA
jgi:hypothetical protein